MSDTLTPPERLDRLRLARTDGVGPVTYQRLMQRFGSAGRALAALPRLAERGGRLGTVPCSRDEAMGELKAGEAIGATLIVLGEAAYPPLLAQTDPPPPVFWTRGEASVLHRPMVALVGARIASAAGQRFAREMAAALGQAGYAVVSGLARGIDRAAHEGSLETGTAAVLGGGIDDIYPPEHTGLYGQIGASGCLVSENIVGRKAKAQDFPRRNRIISGLSLGVVVVEAEMRSGSLITARLANEQGREVFAVPGSPLDPRAKGTNDLIRQGAHLCEGAHDVIATLSGLGGQRSGGQRGGLNDPPGDYDALPEDEDAEIDRLRPHLAALLSPTPVPVDELVRATRAPAPLVFAALTELALAGRCELLPGARVVAS